MIEVIDLFSGPGGLGEGFSQLKHNGKKIFDIKISIEKESFAHQTLTLRSFFKKFDSPPNEYYAYLQGKITKSELFAKYPIQSREAIDETVQAELGHQKFPHVDIINKIKKHIKDTNKSIVIGGPPCQAYSLVGRSKMSKRVDFNNDPRHTLYKEYLKIIADIKPAIFVMENVKGILSSKLNGEYIFDKILQDISVPIKIKLPSRVKFKTDEKYKIYSLTTDKEPSKLSREDFVIKSEDYGIPQCRHRVILLAIRSDLTITPQTLKPCDTSVSIKDVIQDLPKIRSGLSKGLDSFINWKSAILDGINDAKVLMDLSKSAEFLKAEKTPAVYKDWFFDQKIGGVINHAARSHIAKDLQRYYFISNFGAKNKVSPKLQDLPEALLPNHKNVKDAIESKSLFNDRFRVQMANKPATTITSHISKDGHYFIHYDPSQCRSLTVREAARVQTFPDNYKFEGPRTAQYQQVGNAVPPILANQIAEIVWLALSK